jgi:hypothetical protein
MNPLITLVVGFVLTTVLGGVLGAFLQRRTWDHQHAVEAEQAAVSRADEVCRTTMGLLDKRRYRMVRVHLLCQSVAAGGDQADLRQAIDDYDAVLFEWNDQLNAGLALVGTYFGDTARDWLRTEVYENFRVAGTDLNRLCALSPTDPQWPAAEEQAGWRLDVVGDRVYRLGVFMTGQLLRRQVGSKATRPVPAVDSPLGVPAGV